MFLNILGWLVDWLIFFKGGWSHQPEMTISTGETDTFQRSEFRTWSSWIARNGDGGLLCSCAAKGDAASLLEPQTPCFGRSLVELYYQWWQEQGITSNNLGIPIRVLRVIDAGTIGLWYWDTSHNNSNGDMTRYRQQQWLIVIITKHKLLYRRQNLPTLLDNGSTVVHDRPTVLTGR